MEIVNGEEMTGDDGKHPGRSLIFRETFFRIRRDLNILTG